MGRKAPGPNWVAELPNQMKIITKNYLLSGIFLAVFVQAIFSYPALGREESDYDSVIVQPTERIGRANRTERLMYRQGILRYQKVSNDLYVVPVDTSEDKDGKIEALKKSGLFRLVEPNYKLSLDQDVNPKGNFRIVRNIKPDSVQAISKDPQEVIPNDKDFNVQYYLKEINATKAWGTTVGNPLVVGVLDTGVEGDHPDLAGKILDGPNGNGVDIQDDIGHGTQVAGIIAADTNNIEGIAGVAWNVKVLPIKITDEAGQARVSTVVSALDQAYANGVKIVQISLSTNQFSQTLQDAIKQTQDRGLLIVSTAGNSGEEEIRYPSGFPGVIGVGAVDQNKTREVYSTTGDQVSLVAPGRSIFTTTINSSYSSGTGTSFAAPQVSGAAALVWSIAPQLTNNDVRDILLQSAQDLGAQGKDKEYGYGLLDLKKAVELAKTK